MQDDKGEKIAGGITLNEIKLPILVAAKDGVMVAITEANYTNSGEKYAVVTKYLEAKSKDKWKENNNIEEVVKMWKTRLATESESEGKAFSTIMASVVNAEKNKIYAFLLNSTGTEGNEKWEFKRVLGTISGIKGSEEIKWETKDVPELNSVDEIKQKIKQQLSKETLFLTLVDGSAFFTKSGKILFVVKGKSKESTGTSTEQNFIAYFQYEEKPNKLELLDVEITAGWYSSFFEWNGEIYKTPTNGDGDNVMMFNASQNNGFTEINSSPISRLRDVLKDKNNFSTAAIKGEKSMLLFAQEKPSESSRDKKDAHLWMTDGTRVGYVGPILTGFKDISYGPVVHTNNNLFVLHHNYDSEGNTQQNKFNITLLDGQLDKINNIINTWEANEDIIRELYKDTVTESNPCSTDGIVGFLHSTANGGTTKEWTDKYHNGKATMHGSTEVKVDQNGVTFNVAGAGAKWQLKQQHEQPYNFKDFGFTLLATVTVGSSGDKNFILGVGVTANTKNIGLWCTKDGRWGVSVEKDQTNVLLSEINCTPDETYYVALVLEDNKLSAYVNGQKLSKNGGIDVTQLQNIDYFYFGANDATQAKTNVTITDVLLYNRPCEKSKIQQLKPKETIVTGSEQTTGGDNTDPLNDDKNKTGTSPPDTEVTKNNEEEAPQPTSSSPPSTTEDSAARVGVVGVLCFMLFGVFTLLGRYVY